MITDEQIETLVELARGITDGGGLAIVVKDRVDSIRAALADAKKYRWIISKFCKDMSYIDEDDNYEFEFDGVLLGETADDAVTKAMEGE